MRIGLALGIDVFTRHVRAVDLYHLSLPLRSRPSNQ
jgi:hypothetical protein